MRTAMTTAALVLVSFGAGCALVMETDYDEYTARAVDSSAGGSAGSSGAAGSAGDAAAEGGAAGSDGGDSDAHADGDVSGGCDGGPQPLGANGEPCCTPNELACAGHAQKLVLICDPKTLEWSALQSCSGNQLCDTSIGVNQGSCQDPIALCVGKQPGDKVCDGTDSMMCGPDLVTVTTTTCQYACQDGECLGACAPGSRKCNGNTPQVCTSGGQWQGEAPCAYVCTDQGLCAGECTPNDKQCDGNTPRVCGPGSTWTVEAPCSVLCVDGACATSCANNATQCSSGNVQRCVDSAWIDDEDCPYLCSQGACSGSCAPGTMRCSGLVPETCGATASDLSGAACEYVCSAGMCSGECAPGAKACSGLTPRVCDEAGHWKSEAPCAYVCAAGSCTGECSPGNKQCDGLVPRTCNASGEWEIGEACQYVCTAGTCAGACTPNAHQCNGLVPQTCNAQGGWDNAEPCSYVCSNGTCTGSCAPNSTTCNGMTPMLCDANGTWQSGIACPYLCTNGVCTGVCIPGTKQCSGSIPQECDPSGAWKDLASCTSGTVCQAGACVVPNASCASLAQDCGPSGNESCCASSEVPGGTYNRSNDSNFPATLSSFRMDRFEVTTGRFRKFVEAYSNTMIPAGAGKNPSNPADTGWDKAWDAKLPASKDALKAQLSPPTCNIDPSWTAVPGSREKRPINCVTWYLAYAFCIWDGGRLPTEAEWNYAAAGGSDQRVYPWDTTQTPLLPTCTLANVQGCGDVSRDVGATSPAGDAKWGQADMTGNLWEFAQDWSAAYPAPCVNCANLLPATDRVIRGGDNDNPPDKQTTSYRHVYAPDKTGPDVGIRCVRSP